MFSKHVKGAYLKYNMNCKASANGFEFFWSNSFQTLWQNWFFYVFSSTFQGIINVKFCKKNTGRYCTSVYCMYTGCIQKKYTEILDQIL